MAVLDQKPVTVEEIMVRDVAYTTIPGSRDEVLEILKRKKVSGIPVVKNGELIGIVTRKDLLKNPEEEQTSLLMSRNPITIHPQADIREAARIILENNIRRLPVVEDSTLVGLITVADIITVIANMNIQDQVKNYLEDTLVAVWSETPLPVVGEIMELGDVKAVAVLDSELKLLGVVSDKDLISASVIEDTLEKSDMSAGSDEDAWTWESLRDTMSLYYNVSRIKFPPIPVREAIVSNSGTVSAVRSSQVSECARKLKRYHVDQLPVVTSNQKLVGLLRDRDLLKALANQ